MFFLLILKSSGLYIDVYFFHPKYISPGLHILPSLILVCFYNVCLFVTQRKQIMKLHPLYTSLLGICIMHLLILFSFCQSVNLPLQPGIIWSFGLCHFLDATMHLFKSLCPSMGPWVCGSVGPWAHGFIRQAFLKYHRNGDLRTIEHHLDASLFGPNFFSLNPSFPKFFDCVVTLSHSIRGKQVAQSQQIVSSSLALLYILLGFHGGRAAALIGDKVL